ncbi:MAG: hypothetical protein R3D26_21935 [Cyanobacteriota/Melainabacteria group bacterium]
MNLSSLVRNDSINRINQMVSILARYGLADWLTVDAQTPDFVQEKLIGPNGENLSDLSGAKGEDGNHRAWYHFYKVRSAPQHPG